MAESSSASGVKTEVKSGTKKKILKEAEIAKLLSSSEYFPNFVKVYNNSENDKDEYHLEIESVEGRPLYDYMKEHGVSFKLGQYVFYQLGEALETLKNNNIVHRNINGTSVLISKDFRLHFTSLDKAKFGPEVRGFPDGNEFHAAPEVHAWKNGHQQKPYSFESDAYSVGVIAYQMAFHEYPCEIQARAVASSLSCAATEKIDHLVKEAQKKPKLTFPEIEVDRAFEDFMSKLMEVNPHDRLLLRDYQHHPFFVYFDEFQWHGRLNAYFDQICPELNSKPRTSEPESKENELSEYEIEFSMKTEQQDEQSVESTSAVKAVSSDAAHSDLLDNELWRRLLWPPCPPECYVDSDDEESINSAKTAEKKKI